MEKPNKGEFWHIQYGTEKKTNIIVEVLEDKKLNPPNWRQNLFSCNRNGEQILVSGETFIERF